MQQVRRAHLLPIPQQATAKEGFRITEIIRENGYVRVQMVDRNSGKPHTYTTSRPKRTE